MLTGIQIDRRREQLEEISLQRQDLAVKKSALLKTINDEDKKLEITNDQLLDALRTRSEKRLVDCEERFDLGSNTAETFRLDTGETLRERALDGEERALLAQGDLPMPESSRNGVGGAEA